jgi:hypothetical protein
MLALGGGGTFIFAIRILTSSYMDFKEKMALKHKIC